MSDFGTDRRTGTERRSTPREWLRLAHSAPTADFVSQLIAEHRQLPSAPAAATTATSAYDRGARMAIRRMPAGYRTTLIV